MWELKRDVPDSRVSKETVFLSLLPSCHFLHYPRAPLAPQLHFLIHRGESVMPFGWQRKNVPIVIYLTLLHEQLPLSSGHPRSAAQSCPSCGRARRPPHNISSESRVFAGVAVATPGVAQFLEGQSHGNVEALRNVGKYSFRLTPFLPLSDVAATPSPLQDLGYMTGRG